MKIAVVSGRIWIQFTSGHISYLKSASGISDYLIVALNSDEWLINKKKRKSLCHLKKEKNILLNIECVNEVIGFNDDEKGG